MGALSFLFAPRPPDLVASAILPIDPNRFAVSRGAYGPRDPGRGEARVRLIGTTPGFVSRLIGQLGGV